MLCFNTTVHFHQHCSILTWTLLFLSESHTSFFPLVSEGSSWDEGPHYFPPYCLWSDRNSQCKQPAITIHKLKAGTGVNVTSQRPLCNAYNVCFVAAKHNIFGHNFRRVNVLCDKWKPSEVFLQWSPAAGHCTTVPGQFCVSGYGSLV